MKWVSGRGFGFITNDADGQDVFVHFRATSDGRNTLNIGEGVTFDIEMGDKGPKAVNVTGDGTGEPPQESRSGGGFGGRQQYQQQQPQQYGMAAQQYQQPAAAQYQQQQGFGVQQPAAAQQYGMQQQYST